MSDKVTPFMVIVNDEKELSIVPEAIRGFDFIPNGVSAFHVLKDNKAYQAEVIKTDFEQKTFTIKVNGNAYTIKIADKYDRLIKQIGLTVGAKQKANNIKSPMPGLVLSINVAVGDEVKKGDTVLILEAMKMENLIKAPSDAVIKAIHIKQGQAVDKSQLLIDVE